MDTVLSIMDTSVFEYSEKRYRNEIYYYYYLIPDSN